MRDLLRSSEGEISQSEFRRGTKFLVPVTLGVFALLYGISALSRAMDWMTVVVAPFFGVVVLFAVCSLIYFWYCLFAKRSRATGYPLLLVHAWLLAMFAASALRLVDYQNRTLALADSGPIAWSGFGALVLSILSIGLFALLLWRNWRTEG